MQAQCILPIHIPIKLPLKIIFLHILMLLSIFNLNVIDLRVFRVLGSLKLLLLILTILNLLRQMFCLHLHLLFLRQEKRALFFFLASRLIDVRVHLVVRNGLGNSVLITELFHRFCLHCPIHFLRARRRDVHLYVCQLLWAQPHVHLKLWRPRIASTRLRFLLGCNQALVRLKENYLLRRLLFLIGVRLVQGVMRKHIHLLNGLLVLFDLRVDDSYLLVPLRLRVIIRELFVFDVVLHFLRRYWIGLKIGHGNASSRPRMRLLVAGFLLLFLLFEHLAHRAEQ